MPQMTVAIFDVVSFPYKHKRLPISTQRYKNGGNMEKSVLDITDSLRHQKNILTTSDVKNIEGIFVVKLRAHKIDGHFFYTQLPLNEYDEIFEEKLSYMNYKKTVRKLHNTGWKNNYHTSSDVSKLVHGCGVSKYPQFFVEYLYM